MTTIAAVPTLRTLGIFGRPFNEVPEYLRAISREHGPIVKFANPLTTYYFIDDAHYAEELFVSKSSSFMKGRGTQRLKALLGDGLLTAVQPEHLKNRRLVQPAFHRSRIDAFGDVIVNYTRTRVESWKPGATIDVHHETMQLALDIVARTLFGSDLTSEKQTISDALDDALEVFPLMLMPFSELVENLPLPPILRFKRARRELDRVVYDMMRKRRAEGADGGDLLSMLLSTEEDGAGFTDVQVHDEALTILLAGHETTANALAWTFYLLQRNPDIETKLLAHIADVLGDRDPVLEDFPKLDYVRAVASEAMRIYPPAWLTGRRALEDTTIGDFPIRKGEIVLVSQYVTHRNPRYWDEPDRFDPERWMEGSPKEKFAYFPFGGGNRLCIGERFAWLELVFAIATIVRRVKFERIDALDIAPEPLVTMRPKSPVFARVTPR
jgi:cytochrome P450